MCTICMQFVVSSVIIVNHITTRDTDRKEAHPYLAIHAAPRQGKSLFLDMLCERLRSHNNFAFAIIYDSGTPYSAKEDANLDNWLSKAQLMDTFLSPRKAV